MMTNKERWKQEVTDNKTELSFKEWLKDNGNVTITFTPNQYLVLDAFLANINRNMMEEIVDTIKENYDVGVYDKFILTKIRRKNLLNLGKEQIHYIMFDVSNILSGAYKNFD